ncbi:hypothetical protein L9F63_010304, partial [Diploptera punctata]
TAFVKFDHLISYSSFPLTDFRTLFDYGIVNHDEIVQLQMHNSRFFPTLFLLVFL